MTTRITDAQLNTTLDRLNSLTGLDFQFYRAYGGIALVNKNHNWVCPVRQTKRDMYNTLLTMIEFYYQLNK